MSIWIKKIGLFILIIVILTIFTNVLFRLVIPTVILSTGSMEPTYSAGDVLFYSAVDIYDINDIVLMDNLRGWKIVTRIVNINEDGTYKMKGDNNQDSIFFERSVSKEQIQGKITSSASPFIFYGLDYGLKIIIAFFIIFYFFRKK